jgi:hypothetical protein
LRFGVTIAHSARSHIGEVSTLLLDGRLPNWIPRNALAPQTKKHYLKRALEARTEAKTASPTGAALYNRLAEQWEILAANADALGRLIRNLKPKE